MASVRVSVSPAPGSGSTSSSFSSLRSVSGSNRRATDTRHQTATVPSDPPPPYHLAIDPEEGESLVWNNAGACCDARCGPRAQDCHNGVRFYGTPICVYICLCISVFLLISRKIILPPSETLTGRLFTFSYFVVTIGLGAGPLGVFFYKAVPALRGRGHLVVQQLIGAAPCINATAVVACLLAPVPITFMWAVMATYVLAGGGPSDNFGSAEADVNNEADNYGDNFVLLKNFVMVFSIGLSLAFAAGLVVCSSLAGWQNKEDKRVWPKLAPFRYWAYKSLKIDHDQRRPGLARAREAVLADGRIGAVSCTCNIFARYYNLVPVRPSNNNNNNNGANAAAGPMLLVLPHDGDGEDGHTAQTEDQRRRYVVFRLDDGVFGFAPDEHAHFFDVHAVPIGERPLVLLHRCGRPSGRNTYFVRSAHHGRSSTYITVSFETLDGACISDEALDRAFGSIPTRIGWCCSGGV